MREIDDNSSPRKIGHNWKNCRAQLCKTNADFVTCVNLKTGGVVSFRVSRIYDDFPFKIKIVDGERAFSWAGHSTSLIICGSTLSGKGAGWFRTCLKNPRRIGFMHRTLYIIDLQCMRKIGLAE